MSCGMRFWIGATLSLMACSGQPTSPRAGLEATTSVAPAVLRVGETVTVTVVLTNRSDRPLTFEGNVCPDLFEVTTPSGIVVGPVPLICTMVAIHRTLAPGEQATFTQGWSSDGPGAGPDSGAQPLHPGTYLVRGLAHRPDTDSPPAIITITR